MATSYIIRTLVTFTGSNGAAPQAGLITDSAGDLFGTTSAGGSSNDGTVFEIPYDAATHSYGTLQTLVTFTGSNGAGPLAGLITDSAGDLFGTTSAGGSASDGTVFEIPYDAASHSYGTAKTLITFTGSNGNYPEAGLITNSAGDLIGTTSQGGSSGYGTVFEIPYDAATHSYGTLQTLAAFAYFSNGADPAAGLITDSAGDLFGTTTAGGSSTYGTVFEIPYNAGTHSYGTVQTLVTFTGSNGYFPYGGLITDSAGDLFGTTRGNSFSNQYGSVFEIPYNAATHSYGTLQTLAGFNALNGYYPLAGLITDSAGDLFGTTDEGGTSSHGNVFEVPYNAAAHSYETVQSLISFTGPSGAFPVAGLIADSTGHFFGTTYAGGSSNDGTVFELIRAAPHDFNADGTSDMLWQYGATGGIYDLSMSNGQVQSAAVAAYLPSSSWTFLGSGDFNGDGTSDFLDQYNATGGIYDLTMSNGQVTSASLIANLPSSSWRFLGTGDFNGDGTSDFLDQYNATGGIYDLTMSNGQVTSASLVATLPSSQWTYLGTGDFNGDGTTDFLEQYKATGGIYDLGMNNGQVTSAALISNLPSSNWTFLGTGDFNGDGTTDFLEQYNATGGIYDLTMSNGQVASAALVANLPSSQWTFLGTGDYNGDGTSDFLVQYNSTGGVYDLTMSNGQVASASLVTNLPQSAWSHLA